MRWKYYFFIVVILSYFSLPLLGQTNDYWHPYWFDEVGLTIKTEEYYQSIGYDIPGVDRNRIYRRMDNDFSKSLDLEFFSAAFEKGCCTKIYHGHIYDRIQRDPKIQFEHIIFSLGIVCRDNAIDVVVYNVFPGRHRFPGVGFWQIDPIILLGGKDVMRGKYTINAQRTIKWQLQMIDYFNDYLEDIAPKIRDYILNNTNDVLPFQMTEG